MEDAGLLFDRKIWEQECHNSQQHVPIMPGVGKDALFKY